eukprot:COSAG03_NODE_127_length_12134_cov_101.810469_5_plen_54_part_00
MRRLTLPARLIVSMMFIVPSTAPSKICRGLLLPAYPIGVPTWTTQVHPAIAVS